MNNDAQMLQVARTINQQIPAWLHAALGVRDRIALESGLRFKMTGTRPVTTEITYDRGSDLYDMQVYTIRMNRKEFTYKRTVRYEAKQIDAFKMIELLEMMDGGYIEL